MADDLRAFAADLAAAGPKVQRASEKALVDTAEAIAQRARSLVPVQTGATRASIRVTGSGAERTVTAGGAAPYLEFGTSSMAPHPFLYPATDAEEPRLTAALERAVGDAL